MHVIAVNVSQGGVPKLPVDRAWVRPSGLEGDGHTDVTSHGGPYRAVCLYGMEAIERLRAEGHPVDAGSLGENLTTSGVEWSEQPAGTLVHVGEHLVLEVTTSTTPCSTQTHNFVDGRIGRISILTHPSDSRMYARVVREGEVRPGDAIELAAAPVGSMGPRYLLLDRLDGCAAEASLRLWQAAAAAGIDVNIIDDGELAIAASTVSPGPAFNSCHGLRKLPHLLPMALDHFRAAAVIGWLPMETAPWPGAVADFELTMMSRPTAGVPDDRAGTDTASEVSIRRLERDEWRTWADLMLADAGPDDAQVASLVRAAAQLMAARGVHVLVAEEAGVAVGAGTLHVHRRVGLLRAGMVVPAARGRGIQRALIAARCRLARESGCDIVASQAISESPSERNILRLGFERLATGRVYRFDGTGAPSEVPAA
ncbi:MAG: GNAT family N-acetyltransferase [Chloroflexi bacterium]|nr:GNAT family N-acetyltransferase [Chloroflexota bacterium]